jgi:hypothetical protein
MPAKCSFRSRRKKFDNGVALHNPLIAQKDPIPTDNHHAAYGYGIGCDLAHKWPPKDTS